MKIIKAKKIKPTFDHVVTTLNLYEEDLYENGIITHGKGEPMMEQTVIAAGPNTPFKEGMIVHINPIKYAKMKHNKGSLKDGVIEDNSVIDYVLPIIPMGDKLVLFLQSNDIDYIIEDWDDVEIEKPKKQTLILPKKKEIIV